MCELCTNPSLASSPGCSHLQFVVTYSRQEVGGRWGGGGGGGGGRPVNEKGILPGLPLASSCTVFHSHPSASEETAPYCHLQG